METLSESSATGKKTPSRRGRGRFVIVGAMGVLVAAGIGLTVNLAGSGAESSSDVRVDSQTPHVEGDAIVVPAAFAERIELRFRRADLHLLTPLVRAVGTASFDPEYEQIVGTRASGIVTKLRHLEGDRVKPGMPLADIASVALTDARAEVEIARASHQAAKRNAEREQDLVSRGLSTAREAEEAKRMLQEQEALLQAAKQRVKALGGKPRGRRGGYVLRAGIGGTIVERGISQGQTVDVNVKAFRIADVDHLWVEMRIPESRVGQIRKGDLVKLRPVADSLSSPIEGRVSHIGDVIDTATRTAAIRVEVINKARLLRAGQAVRAAIQASGPQKRVLVVPEESVVDVDGNKCVFVESERKDDSGNHHVLRRNIEVGATDGEFREVRTGLKKGERVATGGVFALKSELYR